jgi:acyl-CoA reductase-like NAD-dependent aldehyde dehydrogenase
MSTEPALETQNLKQRAKDFLRPGRLLVAGNWVPAASGKTFSTFNPANKERLTEVPEGDDEDINRAVRAAREAFESATWSKWTNRERGRLLWRVSELIAKHAEELALLETLDTGKVISDSRAGDVPLTIDTFQYYAGWADKIYGETVPVAGPFLNYTLREPVGVVGAIIPWNFPLLLAAWKIAPALACGCTVVLKPAEQTPLTALRLGEILLEAGVPGGVVNIVTGFGPTAGAALASHPDVDKISFTGSTEVGRKILVASGQSNLKRVSLELGGKSPQIVFEESNLDAAAEGVTAGVFMNQGEICHAGSRVFVEDSVHDQLVERLVAISGKKVVGDPLNPESQLGAIVSEEQYDKVLGYLESGKSESATVAFGGEKAQVSGCDGYFVQPTVFTDVNNTMTIAREEIFGPVLSVIPFKDLDDVVEQANKTIYGLAAGIWTNDIKKGHRVAKAIKAGTVWVNTYNAFDMGASWGGYKQSGIGRELGRHALDLYTEHKSVWIQL